MNKSELRNLIRELLHEELSRSTLIESSLTAEEKVDAWHNGTRRENYRAAGIPKLTVFLEIAKRKGYAEIVKIIEDELAKRGASTPVTTSTKAVSTTAPVANSATTTTTEPESEVVTAGAEQETASASPEVVDEPAHFSDELVKDAEIDTVSNTITLSDKEKEVLIGKAIAAVGKPAFYVRSYWKTAMGFIGSYTHKWFNGNFNEVKADRAVDKAVDLTYDSSKLIVLRKETEAGYYYSIEIPSSTYYIVDRAEIRNNANNYYTYYDSKLDWRFSTLTKTNANRKKFKQYLIDTVGMPEVQAEELTIEAFDNNEW